MSQDIRALFKAQATSQSKGKSVKESKKRAPIILEDEDEEEWQVIKKPKGKSLSSSSGEKQKRRRVIQLESDSSEGEEMTASKKAKRPVPPKGGSKRKPSSDSPAKGRIAKSPNKDSKDKVASSPSKGQVKELPSKVKKSPSKVKKSPSKVKKSPSKVKKSPSKTKSKSPIVQTSPIRGAKTPLAAQVPKSDKVTPKAKEKAVSSLTDFFGTAPIKRSQPLTKPAALKKEVVKKTEVISIPETPVDSPSGCLDDDLDLNEAEMSQVLDDIEKEMEEGGAQQEEGGAQQEEGGAQQEGGMLASGRKRTHEREEDEGAVSGPPPSQGSQTPPVKKLKRMVEAAEKNKSPSQGAGSTPRKAQAKAGGASPQIPRASKDTPTSPGKGSTPTLSRGSSYRAYLQRSGPANPGSKPIPEGKPDCLSGLTFVITGELDSLYRDQASSLIQRWGGRVTMTISKKTTHVLVGREAGESKLAKARSLGTKQIGEDELLEMVRSRPAGGTAPSPAGKEGVASRGKGAGKATPAKVEPVKKVVEDVKVVAQPPSSGVGDSSAPPPVGGACPAPSGGCLMWVDKHRPTSLKGVIGQQGARSCANKLVQWLQDWGRHHGLGAEGGARKKTTGGWGSAGGDGSQFKAALLSGPPGVGKTTTATLACKETGYDFTELNASDTRSKRGLAEVVATQLKNTSITAFTSQGVGQGGATRHAVIMDEVDGMSGNEDRGGIQELIQLIKTSQVPIICICNDRQHPKVRSLANHCFDLRFPRPRLDQIKGAMMSVAFKEGVRITPAALEEVILASGQDVRQVLHNLSLWTANRKSLSEQVAKTDASRAKKEIKLGPFDITRKLFSSQEGPLSLQDRSNLFFEDYSFIPLFVQENYITSRPDNIRSIKDHLSRLSTAADALAVGDLVEKSIRSKQNWGLLTLQAVYSCVLPSEAMRGYLSPQVAFPQWLGNNSKRNRLQRLLQDLQLHTHMRTSCNKIEFGLDYLPRLAANLTRPLCSDSTDGVSDVVDLMDHYCLTREDWDSVVELCQFPGQPELVSQIPSKVKAAFTRTYNKERHALPFAVPEGKKVTKRKVSDSSYYGEEEEGEEESEGEVEVVPVKPAPKAHTSKGKGKASGSAGSQGSKRGKGKSKASQ